MRLGRQLVVLTATAVGARGIAIALNFILIRLLAPSELGWFLGIQAMAFAGCGFCDLGLSQGYRVMVSRDHSLRESLLGPTLTIQGIALVLYFAGMCAYLVSKGQFSAVACLVGFGALAIQWTTTADADLRIFKKVWRSCALTVLPVAGLAVATLAAWLSRDSLHRLSMGYFLTMVCAAAISVVLLGGGAWSRRHDAGRTRTLARTSVPFFAAIVVSRLGQFWCLTYVLTTLGSAEAGLLGLPLKVYQSFLVLATITTGTMLPIYHQMSAQSREQELAVVVTRLVRATWVIAGCAAGVCLILPAEIIRLAGGEQYAAAAQILPYLAIAMAIKVVAVPGGDLLEARNLQWLRVAGQAIGTGGQMAAVIYLLPRYGIHVAAAGILGMDVWLFLWYWTGSSLAHRQWAYWRQHLRGATAFGLALVAAMLVPTVALAQAGIFVLVYLTTAYLLGLWRVSDVTQLAAARAHSHGLA